MLVTVNSVVDQALEVLDKRRDKLCYVQTMGIVFARLGRDPELCDLLKEGAEQSQEWLRVDSHVTPISVEVADKRKQWVRDWLRRFQLQEVG